VLFSWGETYLPNSSVTYGIVTDSVGVEMGLRNGDRIISVDGNPVDNFYSVMPDVILNEREIITVDRDGERVDVKIDRAFLPYMIKGMGQIDARIPFGPFEVVGFAKESPALAAGVEKGDRLIGIDGNEFEYYDQFQSYLEDKKGAEITANIVRDGEKINIDLVTTPEGMIGIERSMPDFLELKTVKYTLLESVPAGIKKGYKTLKDYLKQFRIIFSKGSKAYESLGGFITIGSIFPGVWDWQSFWNLTAFLSIILGIMNILPIPALDGGHVMFLIYEVVSGRKPSDKFLEYAQITGMILLLALLIFANGNDILRFIRK
jgi:regulator of sigma E protease